jgi:ribosomal protein S18 acetylase RimI-like enzyme
MRLFHDTVHTVCRADYGEAELDAWSPASGLDPERWRERFARTRPWVALAEGRPVGFLEVDQDGHIDCCYAARDRQRRGVGTALLAHATGIARGAGLARLYAEVSITALPFFARRGFRVVRTQEVERRGQTLRNHLMERSLRPEDSPMPTRDEFRAAIESHDLDRLIGLFREDAVLHSPITFQPFEGKAAVRRLLAIIFEVFQDFRYTDELDAADGMTKVLVFRTRVKDRDVEGVDLVRFDEAGMVRDLTVMVRPRSGMETLLGEVQPRLMAAIAEAQRAS